jgi:hypothetical protein
MRDYVCSKCGKDAYFDGRMGDDPILMCGHGYPHEPIERKNYEKPYGD